jgi:methylthioribose-1-phosphate isomerase
MGTNVQTLRWIDDRLEMIDQRILPAEFTYLSYSSAEEVATGIREMVVRGAPAIGVAAAFGVALEAIRLRTHAVDDFLAGMIKAFNILANSRPTAVNLFWALNRMRSLFDSLLVSHDKESIADLLKKEAIIIYEEDIAINKKMGAFGADLLPNGSRVLTHCNAGALATAGHGTALGVIRSAVEQGKKISVIADETRPFLQGARLTAWEMIQDKIPVTIITDNMAGHLMSCGEIDVVVVGTDRVAANGDVANKIGTYMVAVLAKRHNIPFYVACPLSTIDMNIASGDDIPIEERSIDEVKGFRGGYWAAEGASIRNPAFDVTPSELITGLITEKGVILNPSREKLEKLFLVK